MAQILTIKLTRSDSSCPWGFRLQGGKDFGTPLLIQKVSLGSLAEKAGLQVGDAVLRVNNVEVADQRHKNAQDAIVRAGNSFQITIQRGGLATWKPHVSPVGRVPSPNPYQPISPIPVTKTSLAASKRHSPSRLPCGINSLSKPHAHTQLNGSHEIDGSPIKAIVNNQYNSPVGIYSDESIAETLSAQAEVLAGGVLGVNFKKNEKNYDGESSEVLKMVQEAEKEPKSPEPDNTQNGFTTTSVAGLRHVSAPQTKSPNSESSSLTPGKNICADCERLIVGVFVRIKDKNLHVECFKCATCGTSLKNVGYYSINNKLYCDIHAKMIARQNPPAPNMEPVTTSSPSQYGTPKAFSQISMNNVVTSLPSQNSCHTPNSFHNSSNFDGTNTVAPSPFNNVFARKSGGHGNGIPNSKASAGLSAPRRGKGVWNPQNLAPGARIPLCALCNAQIRGPFITALGKIWCPEHFVCVNQKCKRSLLDVGFVEEPTGLYCEYCFEQYLAPTCAKCGTKVKGDCLNAIGKHFHPECFACAYCGKLFSNNPFFLEDGLPYCENDWNELFTTKCFACGFPIEAGDRWVEALNNNYHSPCFNCTMCKANLEGQSFYAKGGRPYCKKHSH